MTVLALATAILLAGRCAPQVAPETLLSIAQLESGMDPLALHDDTTGETYAASDGPTVAQHAAALIHSGHNVDLGLMQVNSANLPFLHLTVLDAFDACASMRAGAAVLQRAYQGGASTYAQQHALRVALSLYNTGDPTHGFENGYVGRIERVAEHIVPAISPGPLTGLPPAAAPTPTPAPVAPAWDVWGDDDAQPALSAAAPQPTGVQKAAPVVFRPGLIKRTL